MGKFILIMKQARVVLATSAILLAICSLSASVSFADKKNQQTVAFKPAITPMVDVITPQGAPRVYETSAGPTLWSPGSSMVVYKGDTFKIKVFVSTGAYELQHINVRLDGGPLVSMYRAPWETSFDTSTLDTGYHNLRIWAQSDSPAPFSTSEQVLAFYVAQPGEPMTADSTVQAPPSPVTTRVLSNTMTIGGSSTPPQSRPGAFDLPRVLDGAGQTISAIIDLQTPSGRPVLAQDPALITLSSPTVVTVMLPPGSTATRCSYALYRDGSIIYQCNHLLPASGTQILLQAKTASHSGLLPGDVILKAWGVDSRGSYGPETWLDIRIPANIQ